MELRTALITGISGMDGSYLTELLLEKGYTVYGMVRRISTPSFKNIEKIKDKIKLVDGDLLDEASIINAIRKSEPDEIYNFAAQSFVPTSWDQCLYTIKATGLGAVNVFEAARMVENYLGKNIKIYQSSSSEMYGNAPSPQNENTPMIPRSPYAVAKLMAHNMARVYRESYGMFISCGICFNHTGPRRGIEFVSRKISDGVARIKSGLSTHITLGNIKSKRDWSYAKDIVEGIYLMLQQPTPDDYVLSSGESHSIREFLELAFRHVGLNWELYTKFDKSLERPAEIYDLRGDYSKAHAQLNWKPKTSFQELVNIMVDSDLEIYAR